MEPMRLKPFPTTVKTVGDFIRVKRLEYRIRQRDLAEKLSISVRELSAWELDLKQPTETQRMALVRLLGSPDGGPPILAHS